MNDSCECGSTNLTFHENIGFDIWAGGEEKQHVQVCNVCKKVRFVIDVLNWGDLAIPEEEINHRYFGKWDEKSPSMFAIF